MSADLMALLQQGAARDRSSVGDDLLSDPQGAFQAGLLFGLRGLGSPEEGSDEERERKRIEEMLRMLMGMGMLGGGAAAGGGGGRGAGGGLGPAPAGGFASGARRFAPRGSLNNPPPAFPGLPPLSFNTPPMPRDPTTPPNPTHTLGPLSRRRRP